MSIQLAHKSDADIVTPAANKSTVFANSSGVISVKDENGVVSPLGFTGAWTNYTPTWTSDPSPDPSIGNGTLTGAFVQIGETVHFRVEMTAGSTTTFGSGAWEFSLPVTAISLPIPFGLNANGYFEDLGSVAYGPIVVRQQDTTKVQVMYHTGSNGAAANITASAPFTWANGDFIRFSGTYEAV